MRLLISVLSNYELKFYYVKAKGGSPKIPRLPRNKMRVSVMSWVIVL
jgi:hypothetical protein